MIRKTSLRSSAEIESYYKKSLVDIFPNPSAYKYLNKNYYFTEEENKRIVQDVQRLGTDKWSIIAQNLENEFHTKHTALSIKAIWTNVLGSPKYDYA